MWGKCHTHVQNKKIDNLLTPDQTLYQQKSHAMNTKGTQ